MRDLIYSIVNELLKKFIERVAAYEVLSGTMREQIVASYVARHVDC
jgi:hypothetical protein